MFWNVIEGKVDTLELLSEYPKDTNHPSITAMTHGLWHVSHCFDFVRQALMCGGDTSLEWPEETNGVKIITGAASTHVCRSWDDIWKYAQDHVY